MSEQTVRNFIGAINQQDVDAIAALMTDDHQFIDSHHNVIDGKEKMTAGWKDYLEWFPDYNIELNDLLSDGEAVVAHGFASGTYKGLKTENNENYWRQPAAWKAIVEDGKIKLWQVFADTKIQSDIIAKNSMPPVGDVTNEPRKVTAIGGVFFKSKDPEKLREWYNKHLGLNASKWGASFEWRKADDSSKKGSTQWAAFKDDTKYFEPSGKEFMINYCVENLEGLLEELRREGVAIVDNVEASDFGKFVHIMDLEGNKIELWEPNDEG